MPKNKESTILIDDEEQHSRMGVRIPPFWPEDPELWFAQAEGQFAICSIEDDNVNNTCRQYCVRRALTNPVAGKVASTDASNPSNQNRRQPKQRGRASRQNTRRQQPSTRSSSTTGSSHTSNCSMGNADGSAYKASRSTHHTNGEIDKTNRRKKPSKSGKKSFKEQNKAGNA
ncbi:lysosomal alpha-glucosidase-like protein [Lasius niger]|uniref:Lysosomal alpha-glucosidase-like protein n=1 Tax=Lasius niger TaxID=67767 RepID=A0A0J7MZG9_LASNI|nr:lysosomal alpha-glucosidase-like protein [Lasius niger]